MPMEKAPQWSVQSLDGQSSLKLSDFQGKPTLLLFFNLGCLGCMSRGLPLAAELARAYPDLNVVGIHSEFGRQYASDMIQRALAEKNVGFPVLRDEDHRTYDAYHAEGTPHWVLLNERGAIEKSIFGSQPNAQQRLTYAMIERFGY